MNLINEVLKDAPLVQHLEFYVFLVSGIITGGAGGHLMNALLISHQKSNKRTRRKVLAAPCGDNLLNCIPSQAESLFEDN